MTSPLEMSKCIPVLACNNENVENDINNILDGDNNNNNNIIKDDNHKYPPEYVMIELNGELIAPIEYPSPDACRTILGKESTVELGKLRFDDVNKVILTEVDFYVQKQNLKTTLAT
jgi:hypothetical protein